MSMYAIVKTGGKQYRVEQGQNLLVERLPVAEGATVALSRCCVRRRRRCVDGEGSSSVSVTATVVAHERGPKLRIVKFKPKRGYKRRTGHRQKLTRIEVTSIGARGALGRRGNCDEEASRWLIRRDLAPPATVATPSPAARREVFAGEAVTGGEIIVASAARSSSRATASASEGTTRCTRVRRHRRVHARPARPRDLGGARVGLLRVWARRQSRAALPPSSTPVAAGWLASRTGGARFGSPGRHGRPPEADRHGSPRQRMRPEAAVEP